MPWYDLIMKKKNKLPELSIELDGKVFILETSESGKVDRTEIEPESVLLILRTAVEETIMSMTAARKKSLTKKMKS